MHIYIYIYDLVSFAANKAKHIAAHAKKLINIDSNEISKINKDIIEQRNALQPMPRYRSKHADMTNKCLDKTTIEGNKKKRADMT